MIGLEELTLPFNVPSQVSRDCDSFDGGYLRRLLPKLNSLDAIHDFNEINSFCFDFAGEHERGILYNRNYNNEWLLSSDFVYRKLSFEGERACFSGLLSSVDGSYRDVPDRRDYDFLHMNQRKGASLIPYVLGNDVKAIVVGQEVASSPVHYSVELLVGDNYDLEDNKMPFFKKIHDFGALLLGIDPRCFENVDS